MSQCTPFAFFCVGPKAMQCAADGKSANLIETCPEYELPDGGTISCETAGPYCILPAGGGACCCNLGGCGSF
jgi:hypothetical protein